MNPFEARSPGRGPTSREVTLAWSIQLDADAHERGRSSPLFETAVVDPNDEDGSVIRGVSPSELLDWTDGAFAADEFEGDRWTFLCLLHDDDWANGNGEGLAERLAKLARGTSGVVVAAHMERVVNAWVLRKGVAREVTPLPKLAFAPTQTIEGTRSALDAVETVLAAMPRAKAAPFDRVLPALVEKHLRPFGLEATENPLHYRFAAQPDFELRFVRRKRRCVPFLCRVGGAESEGHALRELPGEKLDEELSALGSRAYDALAVQWPLFLAENGEAVPASDLVASLQEVRWEVKRIAEAPRTHAEVIRTCADFLLSGVWDDNARENLIRLVRHANCPRSIAERLASHTSKSLQEACAERLKRD